MRHSKARVLFSALMMAGVAVSSANAQAPAATATPAAKAPETHKADDTKWPQAVPGGEVWASMVSHESSAKQIELGTSLLAADKARVAAIAGKDKTALGEVVADDIIAIVGVNPAGKQYLDKAGYIAAAGASGTTVTDMAAKMYGALSDVGSVSGIIRDASGTPKAAYTAVYINFLDAWQVMRYIESPLGDAGAGARATPATWNPAQMASLEQRVFGYFKNSVDAAAARDAAKLDPLIGAEFWNIDTADAAAIEKGKAAYAAAVAAGNGPGAAALDKPDFAFIGNYGDTAILVGKRFDTAAPANAGNADYYLAVVERGGLRQDDWHMTHYHSTPIR